MRTTALTLTLILSLAAGPARALESDNDQPATIEADEVEFDFRTGERTYTGDVVVVQGTLRITGDKMVIQYDQDSEQIETATSWGSPATFKQRPEGKDGDVYGEGKTIVMNQIENKLTLIEDASMTQAGNTANGNEIVYDMSTDKMTVKGFKQPKQGDEITTDSDTGRARVTIKPGDGAGSGDDQGGGQGEDQDADTNENNGADDESADDGQTAE